MRKKKHILYKKIKKKMKINFTRNNNKKKIYSFVKYSQTRPILIPTRRYDA